MNIPIPIKLDTERNFKFTIGSVARFDTKFERKFMQVTMGLAGMFASFGSGNISAALEQIRFDDIVNLVWCGLLHEEKSLTTERSEAIVEEFIENGGDFGTIMTALGEAWGNFLATGVMKLPKSENEEKNEKPPTNQNNETNQESPSPTSESGSENPSPTPTES